jgi:hypothetical protein
MRNLDDLVERQEGANRMPHIGYDLPKKRMPGEAVSLGYADVGTGI